MFDIFLGTKIMCFKEECLDNLNEFHHVVSLVKLDYNNFASGSNDSIIIIWDFLEQKKYKSLNGHLHDEKFFDKPDSSRYMCGSKDDASIKLSEMNEQNKYKIFKSRSQAVNYQLRLNNSQFISGCSDDKSIKLWD